MYTELFNVITLLIKIEPHLSIKSYYWNFKDIPNPDIHFLHFFSIKDGKQGHSSVFLFNLAADMQFYFILL